MKKQLLSFICLVTALPVFSQVNNFSMQFDGVDDYIDYTSQVVVPSFPITIQTDIKLPADFQGSDQFFVFHSDDRVGDYSGFWMSVHSDFVEISFGDGQGEGTNFRQSLTADHSIILDHWVNIACIINGANDMKIYQNAVELLNSDYSGGGGTYVADEAGGNSFTAHSVGSGGSVYNEGKVDNLAIWSTELTQMEVKNYMICPPTGSESGLVAFWNFEEGTGTTTQDLTGNNHTGNLMNSPTWSTDTPPNYCSLGLNEAPTLVNSTPRVLVEIVDILGRKVDFQYDVLQIYRYSDGSSEKVFVPKN